MYKEKKEPYILYTVYALYSSLYYGPRLPIHFFLLHSRATLKYKPNTPTTGRVSSSVRPHTTTQNVAYPRPNNHGRVPPQSTDQPLHVPAHAYTGTRHKRTQKAFCTCVYMYMYLPKPAKGVFAHGIVVACGR